MTTRAEPVPVTGDVIAEKYRVERVLGEGGMGTVLAAVHLFTDRKVAIKWMLPALSSEPEACARFLREAQIAGRLEHPSIVDVHDVGRERGSMYLVMELLQGETLHALLRRDGPLSPTDAIRLLMPVLRAVSVAHAAGVLHRDLKPENVFLCRDSTGRALEPKVLDFGVSKLLDAPESMKLTRTGTVVGTMFYMAPEQIMAAEVGPPADVFALGVLLYECMTGVMPYDAANFNALVVEMATRRAIPLRERNASIDAELEAVVLRALERDVGDRYPDVASFATALEPFAAGTQFELPRETWRQVPATPHQVPATPQTGPVVDAGATSIGLTSEVTTPARPPIRSTSSVLVWLGAGVVVLAGASVAAWLSLFGISSSTGQHASPHEPARPSRPASAFATDNAPAPSVAPVLAPPRAVTPIPADLHARDGVVIEQTEEPLNGAIDDVTEQAPRADDISRRSRRSGGRPPDVRRSPRSPRMRVEDF